MRRSIEAGITNVRRMTAVVGGLILLGVAGAKADDFTFGVGTHFAFPTTRGYIPKTQRPLLADLGVDSFRDDVDADFFTNASLAKPLGTQLDRLSEVVADDLYRPVLILRGAKLEDGPKPRLVPRTAAETKRFASYAANVTRATRSYRPFYEVWNEWNMSWRAAGKLHGLLPGKENPDFSPENYVTVAEAAYASIKSADPSATVLTGAIGEDEGWTWTRRALKVGLARTGDGISVHLYNHCNPPNARTAEALIEKAEAFRQAVADETGGRIPPIYLTEFGWPNDTGDCGIPLDLAAANLAQFTLWASSTDWLHGIWAYELRDSGTNDQEREDNFGLYTYDDRPKQAVCAYREAIRLSRELRDKRFREAPDGLRWLEGTAADGSKVWAIWTTERDARGAIELEVSKSRSMRMLCSTKEEEALTTAIIGPLPLVIRAVEGIGPGDVQLRVDRR